MLVSLLAATSLAGCHEDPGGGDAGGDHDTYTIGALMVLSGDLANLGQDTLNGVQLAVLEINAAGGIDGTMLELEAVDTKLDGTEAQAGFERLAGDGVEFIVGALASGITGAVTDRATSNEIVLMSPSSTNPDLTGPNHGYFYRIIAHDGVQGPQAADIVYDTLAADEIAVMFEQTDYAQGLEATFVSSFESLGGTVAGDSVAWKGAERASHAGKAQEAVAQGTDVIWIAGQGDGLANLVKEIRKAGFEGTVITSEAIEQESIFDVAEADIDGTLFTKASPDFASSAYTDFATAYEAEFDSQPGAFSAFAYDAVYVAAAAIEAVGYDGPAMKAWLDANAVDGRVTTPSVAFDANGDVTTGGYTLWEIHYESADNRGFRPYEA